MFTSSIRRTALRSSLTLSHNLAAFSKLNSSSNNGSKFIHTQQQRHVGYRRVVNKQVVSHLRRTRYMMPYRQTGRIDYSIFPQRFQIEMERKGYFNANDQHWNWEYMLEPHFKQALTYQRIARGVGPRVLSNWVDELYQYKQRDLRHPDFPMFQDKYFARLRDVSWEQSPMLVEKLLSTKVSLHRLDMQHQQELFMRAPSVAITPSVSAEGHFMYLKDPPNAPMPPRRPRTTPTYPWTAPIDYKHVKTNE
jgi:hypothetical protein